MADTNGRKWERMQKKFGLSSAGNCKGCAHFVKYTHHGRTYSKCKIYGISASEATDWNGSAKACGLYPGKPYNGGAIVREIERRRKKQENIDGQQSLFGEGGANGQERNKEA